MSYAFFFSKPFQACGPVASSTTVGLRQNGQMKDYRKDHNIIELENREEVHQHLMKMAEQLVNVDPIKSFWARTALDDFLRETNPRQRQRFEMRFQSQQESREESILERPNFKVACVCVPQ